jgi:hypothetical protein
MRPFFETDLTLASAARLARCTPTELSYWLHQGDLPPEIQIPTRGHSWHLPSDALVRHLRVVNPYLGDRIAEAVARLEASWSAPRYRRSP